MNQNPMLKYFPQHFPQGVENTPDPAMDFDVTSAILNSFDKETKRAVLVAAALVGVVSASGMNVGVDIAARKAVEFADATIREMEKK